ncbi:proline-rich transmembrane protein 3 [Betta splendens]|uniref:Proline-rich transmembrane protein 3 n=1 Tax=Betta splendens TaxID=158456 RepID=A0A6P7MVX7_BETSP|nr:proline-rich transmembrane protein 3 [Betta splendens]XP_029011119.1 proline-rich transmembrane protein 3 [Betta splendens]XP_029011120.1 proline-rich transmembrane protein 3 [Betta splendens]XP_029011121.1 proline-rich transmembrane protein 3 [Betta splendens]
MAPLSLRLLVLLLSIIHASDSQTVIGASSSFSRLDLPLNSPSPATKYTARLWASLSPRGRSDVPVKPTDGGQAAAPNAAQQERRAPHPSPTFTSALAAQNLSYRPRSIQPTASRPRTDTASLASIRSLGKGDAATKGFIRLLPTVSPSVTATGEKSVKEAEDEDPQGLGSASGPTLPLQEESAEETAPYRPRAQTVVPKVSATPELPLQSVKPDLYVLTAASKTSTTPRSGVRGTASPAATQATPPTEALPGELTTNASKPDSAAAAAPRDQTTDPGSNDTRPQTSEVAARGRGRNRSHVATTSAAQELGGASSDATDQLNRTAALGRRTANGTMQQTPRTGISFLTTGVVPVTRRLGSTYEADISQRNRSVLSGHPRMAPHSTSGPGAGPEAGPEAAPSADPSPNATLLYWGDLSRTLAVAWELHVYGSATLFLLIFAGAALGLTLSPGASCPQRGALALANALLFAAGGLRGALLLMDPYGTRRFLPRPAVTALYNLPLHLLVWAQAALALLAVRVSGVGVLPAAVERPPLLAVLAVLQCTLLLAADLLSPALSPLVPVTLQVLSLCWGLALCLSFLCYVFPRIRRPPIPRPVVPEEARAKDGSGSRRTGIVLGRVLAACAVLGTLCCGLHVHATLWLYGLLGSWTRFNWGWWLVHFWARLLELAWGFSLLFLGSWVFWRPRSCRGREEGGPEGRAAGDLPSPGQSAGSTPRHTCWSKIVQSLRGKPCRKSDSNGVGGGGGPGDVPNNWTGHERPGADISKSLIRNQNHEQVALQSRCIKDNNRGRNPRGHSAERAVSDGSAGSLLRLQALGRPPPSQSGGLDQDRDTSLSLYEFDLRPPSPIDLTRSIDEALHREHLLEGGSLFHPLSQSLQPPSPGSGGSRGPWLRRNSDPQLLSESSDAPTESSMPLGGSVLSSVPSRQVTAPPTPSHQGHRWPGSATGSVPSSVSCPVSLRPSRTSTGHLGEEVVDDTRPFITPDSERGRAKARRPVGSRSYLEVGRHDDSASVSSEIIDL